MIISQKVLIFFKELAFYFVNFSVFFFLLLILFISTLTLIIFFFLFVLDLVCASFLVFLTWEHMLLI